MRIGWATPFNAGSAVSRHALEVIREMRTRGLNVEIIRTEVGAAAQMNALSKEIPVRGLNETSIAALREDFDLLVVALVDEFESCVGSLDVLRSTPSVGVFYDTDLRHLSGGSTEAGIGQSTVGRLRAIDPVAQRGDHPFGEDLAWVSTLCAGAVVHSSHYLSR